MFCNNVIVTLRAVRMRENARGRMPDLKSRVLPATAQTDPRLIIKTFWKLRALHLMLLKFHISAFCIFAFSRHTLVYIYIGDSRRIWIHCNNSVVPFFPAILQSRYSRANGKTFSLSFGGAAGFEGEIDSEGPPHAVSRIKWAGVESSHFRSIRTLILRETILDLDSRVISSWQS